MTNPKTTWTGYAQAGSLLLTLIASASYNLGPVATLFSPTVKQDVFIVGAIATALLTAIKSTFTQDAAPTPTSPTVEPTPGAAHSPGDSALPKPVGSGGVRAGAR